MAAVVLGLAAMLALALAVVLTLGWRMEVKWALGIYMYATIRDSASVQSSQRQATSIVAII